MEQVQHPLAIKNVPGWNSSGRSIWGVYKIWMCDRDRSRYGLDGIQRIKKVEVSAIDVDVRRLAIQETVRIHIRVDARLIRSVHLRVVLVLRQDILRVALYVIKP